MYINLHLCVHKGVPEGCPRPVPGAGKGPSTHQEDPGSTALYQGLVSQVRQRFFYKVGFSL